MKSDINILRWWEPIIYNNYAHFNQDDKAIWDSFLKTEAVKFVRFSYDVPLIEESQLEASHPDYLLSAWDYLKAYKIDAIGESLDTIHLFEVKPLLCHQAIGQIQVYRSLFPDKYQIYRKLSSNIVCLSGPSVLYSVCRSLNINVYTVI